MVILVVLAGVTNFYIFSNYTLLSYFKYFSLVNLIFEIGYEIMKMYLVIYFGLMANSYIDIMQNQYEINRGRSMTCIYIMAIFCFILSLIQMFKKTYANVQEFRHEYCFDGFDDFFWYTYQLWILQVTIFGLYMLSFINFMSNNSDNDASYKQTEDDIS